MDNIQEMTLESQLEINGGDGWAFGLAAALVIAGGITGAPVVVAGAVVYACVSYMFIE